MQVVAGRPSDQQIRGTFSNKRSSVTKKNGHRKQIILIITRC